MKTFLIVRLPLAVGFFLLSVPVRADMDRVGLKNGNVFNGRIVPGAPAPLTSIDNDTDASKPAPAPRQDPVAEEATKGEAGPSGQEDKIPDFVTMELDLGGKITFAAADIAWIEDVENPPEEIGPAKGVPKGKAAPPKKPPAKKPPPKKPAAPKPPAKPKSG